MIAVDNANHHVRISIKIVTTVTKKIIYEEQRPKGHLESSQYVC